MKPGEILNYRLAIERFQESKRLYVDAGRLTISHTLMAGLAESRGDTFNPEDTMDLMLYSTVADEKLASDARELHAHEARMFVELFQAPANDMFEPVQDSIGSDEEEQSVRIRRRIINCKTLGKLEAQSIEKKDGPEYRLYLVDDEGMIIPKYGELIVFNVLASYEGTVPEVAMLTEQIETLVSVFQEAGANILEP